jgi:hypothetical protein
MSEPLLSNRKLRNIHRDLGYFYVGLIIAFGISGIAQNHRKQWKPDKYLYEHQKVQTNFRLPIGSVHKDSIKAFSKRYGLEEMRQYDYRKDSTLVISYKDADATIKLESGKAEINTWRKKPVMSQLVFLHKNNASQWWLWYSDIVPVIAILLLY